MTVKKVFKLFFLIISISVISVSVLLFLYLITPRPPADMVADAREALSGAGKSKANVYVAKQYKIASNLYDSIILEWKKQNNNFFLKRDFSKVEELAEQAAEVAQRVAEESDLLVNNLEEFLTVKIDTLNYKVENYNAIITKLPLPKNTIETFTKGTLIYSEGKSAYQQKNFNLGINKIDEAELYFNEVFGKVNNLLTDYFVNYKKWIQWKDETIQLSRKKQCTVIIVDKFDRKCLIYQQGKLQGSYDIELGPKWIGDKRHRGDNATPEGKYKIEKKIPLRETKYYKALLINYPNDDDKRQFDNEIRNGTLPKNAEIGGLIEIHGDGGKGFHWTNGCIALKNEDMDKVYTLASAGTPVTIIGSQKKLSDIFNLK